MLAQVLPVTYNDVDPQAYKNVTVCPANAPASAPTPAWQGYGPPSAHAPLAALNLPGSPGQHVGRRRLQVRKALSPFMLCAILSMDKPPLNSTQALSISHISRAYGILRDTYHGAATCADFHYQDGSTVVV